MMRVLRVLRVLFSVLRGRNAVTDSRGECGIAPAPPASPAGGDRPGGLDSQRAFKGLCA